MTTPWQQGQPQGDMDSDSPEDDHTETVDAMQQVLISQGMPEDLAGKAAAELVRLNEQRRGGSAQ